MVTRIRCRGTTKKTKIVTEFLKSQEQETSALETSFYHYQHANDQPRNRPDSKKTDNKSAEQSRQKQEQVKIKQEPINKAKQDFPKPKEEVKVSRS